ncbi:MAG: universal stress protein [Halobacteriaceae archaeon]
MEVETVLAPVDGSDESRTAARYAVAVARQYDAGVHLLYVLGERVSRGVTSGDLDSSDVAEESRAFVSGLRQHAAEHDVPASSSVVYGFSTTRKLHHPGSVVLDAAAEVDADFLVLPREPAAGGGEALEKVAEYVLLYASQPVLSV